jgi:DNA replication and repair protein RecF
LTTLNKLTFFQYKNYTDFQMEFWGKIVCICGGNGTGKTNLLDAIYYLCYTKSYLGFSDMQMQQLQAIGMNISGHFKYKNLETFIKIINRQNLKKELWVNDIEQKQLFKHAGKIPCVFIAPDDVEIITGSASLRRKLMDASISQVNTDYLIALSNYNKVITQRNVLLKNWHESSSESKGLLPFYDHELISLANFIFKERQSFLHDFLDEVKNIYGVLCNQTDKIFLRYNSSLINNNLKDLFKESIKVDIALGRTSKGIHKDDIFIGFSETILWKDTASQGQKKTMLFALKLAQFNYLKQKLHISPILLLDDVFEKLDTIRSEKLLQFIAQADCQVFITDTQKKRLQQHFMGNDDVQFLG